MAVNNLTTGSLPSGSDGSHGARVYTTTHQELADVQIGEIHGVESTDAEGLRRLQTAVALHPELRPVAWELYDHT